MSADVNQQFGEEAPRVNQVLINNHDHNFFKISSSAVSRTHFEWCFYSGSPSSTTLATSKTQT